MQAAPEAMSDDDQIAALACSAHGLDKLRLVLLRQIVLRDGFKHGEEIASGRSDFPALLAAQHITVAENIDGRHARGQSPDPRLPLGAAGGEDRDVPVEGGERRATAVMTGQYL